MGEIKLLRRLWQREAGSIMNASTEQESFAVRKGYAEPYNQKIKSKKAKVKKEAPENKSMPNAPENKFLGTKDMK